MTDPHSPDASRIVLVVGTGRDPAAIEASLRAAGFVPESIAGPVEAVLRAARDPSRIAGAIFRAESLREEDLESISAIRRTLPGASLIVLHGAASREKAARALLLGADAAIAEPFYWIELVAVLGRMARREPAASPPERAASNPERELELVTRLAGGVAHEINNPLTIISGWVQVLLTEVAEAEPRHRTLVAIRDEAARIARIVKDLQTFARRKVLTLAAVDLNAIVRTEVAGAELAPALAELKTTLRLAEPLAAVAGDAAQIAEIVRHLLRNAAGATPRGGEIAVETRAEDGVVRLVVRDTGRGIPAAERDRIFDPFFPGNPKGQGPGLGLAVSLAIARAHGGDLELLDTGERGSAFRLTLPTGPARPDSSE
jgi:signal transduction histidine kinase